MKFFIVNVFAKEKYSGNPLAVYLCEGGMQYEEMHQIAYEMHFSESVFITVPKNVGGGFDVRIFTPDTEVPFAGHPLLGAAYVISQIYEEREISIHLIGGNTIPIIVIDNIATMNLSSYSLGKTFSRRMAANLLSVKEEDIDDDYPIQVMSAGLPSLAIPLTNINALKMCKVNADEFTRYINENGKANLYPFLKYKGSIRARCFMDDSGFLEDPATGSASAALAGYILRYGYLGSHEQTSYTVIQGQEMMRESRIEINAKNANNNTLISVSGAVTSIANGEWL